MDFQSRKGSLLPLAFQGCRNLNAGKIIAIDLLDNKLEYAKQFGATHTINGKDKNIVEEVNKICPGGVDYGGLACESGPQSAQVLQ